MFRSNAARNIPAINRTGSASPAGGQLSRANRRDPPPTAG
jgi:hypothetical protein